MFQVPLKRVHLFTTIQLTCLACLWIIKSFSSTSILFPLMVRYLSNDDKSRTIFNIYWLSILLSYRNIVLFIIIYYFFLLEWYFTQLMVMIGIRKSLDLMFTQRELKILDDIMPEPSKKHAEDLRQLESGEVSTVRRILNIIIGRK